MTKIKTKYIEAGTDNYVLTSSSGVADWAAAASSGQVTYDAIVDSTGGGDYTTLGAAITAGKVIILLRGQTSESGPITLPNYCLIHGADGNEWIIMNTHVLTCGISNVLSNFFIRSTKVDGPQIIAGESCRFEGMRFQNNSGTNPASAQGVVSDNNLAKTRVMFNNCQMQIQNNTSDIPNMIGIHIQNANSNGWEINNMSFAGQGSTYSCQLVNCATDALVMNNIFVKNIGQLSADSFTISGNGCSFSNFHIDTTNVFNLNISGDRNLISNFRIEASAVDFKVDGLYNNLTNISCEGELIIGAAAHLNNISNSQFVTGITVSGDNNIISGCRAGADAGGGAVTVTLPSGGDNNIITNTFVDATISDSGTGNVTDTVIY